MCNFHTYAPSRARVYFLVYYNIKFIIYIIDKGGNMWYNIIGVIICLNSYTKKRNRKNMRILGIDPGYAIVGYGVVDLSASKFTPVDFGVITTPAKIPIEDRLSSIYDELSVII